MTNFPQENSANKPEQQFVGRVFHRSLPTWSLLQRQHSYEIQITKCGLKTAVSNECRENQGKREYPPSEGS